MFSRLGRKKDGGLKKGTPTDNVPYDPSEEETKLLSECDEILKKITIWEAKEEAESKKKNPPGEPCEYLKKGYKFDFSGIPEKPEAIRNKYKSGKEAETLDVEEANILKHCQDGVGEDARALLKNALGHSDVFNYYPKKDPQSGTPNSVEEIIKVVETYTSGSEGSEGDNFEYEEEQKFRESGGGDMSSRGRRSSSSFDEAVQRVTAGNLGSVHPVLKKYNHSLFEKAANSLDEFFKPDIQKDELFKGKYDETIVPKELRDEVTAMFLQGLNIEKNLEISKENIREQLDESSSVLTKLQSKKLPDSKNGRKSKPKNPIKKIYKNDSSDSSSDIDEDDILSLPDEDLDELEKKERKRIGEIAKKTKGYSTFTPDDEHLINRIDFEGDSPIPKIKKKPPPVKEKQTKENPHIHHRIHVKESQPDILKLRRPKEKKKSANVFIAPQLSEELVRSPDIGLSEDILPTSPEAYLKAVKRDAVIPKKRVVRGSKTRAADYLPDVPEVLDSSGAADKHLNKLIKPLNRLAPAKSKRKTTTTFENKF